MLPLNGKNSELFLVSVTSIGTEEKKKKKITFTRLNLMSTGTQPQLS